MYPDRDTLSNVPRSVYITARDQSMVESGLTEGGKNDASFHFRGWKQHGVHNTNFNLSLKLKSVIFKVIPVEKQQLVEEKMQIT